MLMGVLAFLRFESPEYLALLALLPLLVALSFRSLAGLGAWRRGAALLMRCVVVLLIVLALAGAQRTQAVDDLSIIFLMDRSNSVPSELQREGFDYVRRAEKQREPDDRIGVIGFDGVAGVEQRPMRTLDIDHVTDGTQPDQTNLAAATRLALAMLPSDTAGRVVVVSDGNENFGDVLKEAEQFSAANIPIDVLPLLYEHENEVVFEQLKAPATAKQDEAISLQMVLRAQRRCAGEILLWHNDTLLDLNGPKPGTGFDVELEAGPNRFVRQIPLHGSRSQRFRAQFVPADESTDTLKDNNVGRAFTYVYGKGKVLILTTIEDQQSDQPTSLVLREALTRENLECEVEVAGAQPDLKERLLDYSLVVLDNVPAGNLRDEEKRALAVYVREVGGGLIMIGGDDSFGAGGWLGSPVEEVMPVSFDVKHKKEFIKGALVLVMHACEVPDGNHIGERAAIDAVKTLSARDLVGVLAWKWHGTAQKNWAVPLQEVGDKRRIIAGIKKMSMGDLPDLDEVMRPGVEALLKRNDAGPKHMIVISDFDPQAPRPDLIKKMKQHGITCSTIAIGYGGHRIDENKARWIAQSTGGRFHPTNDFSKIPQIFIKESRLVRRSLVQEGPFEPKLVNPISPLAAGLSQQALPELKGFVLTTAKPTATVPIVRKSKDGDDPILAHWQVGSGKAVAFTSGLWRKWGPQWHGWGRFSTFWAQVVRWASRQAEEAAFDVTTTVQGGRAKLRIDALDKNAATVNFMDVRGRVLTPGDETKALQLTQTGPGQYEGEFDAQDRGSYIVLVDYAMGHGEQASSGTLSTGLTVAFSPEYAQMQPNLPLLDELRANTSGRILRGDAPEAAFERAGLPAAETRHVIWETLIRWMLILFLLDVAVRRIAISPIEMARKARRFLSEVAGRGRPASEATTVLTTLKSTRERVRDERLDAGRADDTGGTPAPTARYEPRTPDQKATEDLGRALGGATEQDTPVVAKPTGKKPSQSEADYTSRLLKAKRRAREDMRKDEDQDSS